MQIDKRGKPKIIPPELRVIEKLIPQFFELVERELESGKMKVKERGDVLTPTDIKINKLFITEIKKEFPLDSILSEESGAESMESDGRLWCLDPLCGTTNFVSGILFFCTNISLVDKDKKHVFALVVDYSKKTYYWAFKDNAGVYQEREKIIARIQPNRIRYLNVDEGKLPISGTDEERSHLGRICHQLACQKYSLWNILSSLSFAYTALGLAAGLIVTKAKPWDLAASSYLMEKNGGVVTDFKGNPWRFKTENLVGSLDKRIHKKLLGIIKRAKKEKEKYYHE